tara:strand:+ start:22 stop:822 length:801 start_codon:yes stop_codon:yes gene_type:complete
MKKIMKSLINITKNHLIKNINLKNEKMKKTLLLIAVLFAAFTMNAQNPYSVADQDGTEITEGMVVEFTSPNAAERSLDYYVTNNSAEDIYMRIEFVDAVNYDGTGFELCFGLCYYDLEVGESVPQAPQSVIIAAGSTTPDYNHFAATLPSSEVQDYSFRFHQTDSEGNDIGNSLNFTYRYNPILGLEDFNELGVTLTSTVILNDMQVNTLEELDMVIYNLQGKLVNSQKVSVGNQLINMSNLSSQMYIVKFSNNEGVSKTIKIVKK